MFRYAVGRLLCLVFLVVCGAAAGRELPIGPERIKTHQDYPGVRIVKDIPYGNRADLPGEGATYAYGGRRIDFLGEPCTGHRTGQFFDLYLPAAIDLKRPAVLYIHGGGFCQPYDKNTQGQFFAALARRGWVVASANYVLQNDVTATPPRPLREKASLREMAQDVDLCVSYLKDFLPTLGVRTDGLVLAGESAGGCISSLYSYDQAAPEKLGLGLRHAIPVVLELNIAGAVDLEDESIRTAIGGPSVVGTLYRGLMGEDAAKPERRRWYSPVNLVCKGSVPTIAAYSVFSQARIAGDGCIGRATYDGLTNALARCGVRHSARLFDNMWHCEMIVPGTPAREEAREWIFRELERFVRLPSGDRSECR